MNYKVLEAEDIAALQQIVKDRERLLTGDAISEDYSHDELVGEQCFPDVVVKAISAQEIAEIMRYAWENHIPVTPRGAGTGLVGAAIPVESGILLDLSLMNQILELDEDNLSLTVEPGVLLMDVTAFVEERGLFYPPDPGEKTATIGGNISTNAGGMRAVKYGVTRDYVQGLEVVLPNGERIELGGKIVKNSSGYDLKDLIIGSEGTLGIVTKAILKLLPLPAKTISLLIPFPSLEQAIGTVPRIIREKSTPTAIEFLDRDVILDAEEYLGKKFPDNSSSAYLLLRFDGPSTADIEREYDEVARICLEEGALDVLISDTAERDESIWNARGSFLQAIKSANASLVEIDAVVPRSRVNDLVSYMHAVQEETDTRIKCFGHAGDGNLHIYVLKETQDEPDWDRKAEAAMAKIYQYAKELDGQVSGEHGIGYDKRAYLNESLSAVVLDLMRGVKKAFDPRNILNPSKIL
ncbi:MAG: FAD-binding oxidoreductase [Clostridiales bacterium]|nr:FAD-binding oxidoreductase [Clostridiales bacterium]